MYNRSANQYRHHPSGALGNLPAAAAAKHRTEDGKTNQRSYEAEATATTIPPAATTAVTASVPPTTAAIITAAAATIVAATAIIITAAVTGGAGIIAGCAAVVGAVIVSAAIIVKHSITSYRSKYCRCSRRSILHSMNKPPDV